MRHKLEEVVLAAQRGKVRLMEKKAKKASLMMHLGGN
jgi:hypothetical protein